MEILADKHVRTGKREAPWPEYVKMVGGAWSDDPPKSGHAPRHIFTVATADPQHAIMRDLGGAKFQVSDELYHNLRTQPDIHVIASAYDDPAIGGTGKNEPMLWTVEYGKGRVFHTALGHDVSAMLEPGFIATFVRGAEWAATGGVTIAAKLEPETPRGSPRVLVVTGGHDHETTFYTMFESFTGMQVNVNPHPIAFNRDLRKDYDVLVLYDSVQTLDDKQKTNLKAFVEAGDKGLVALHHSIIDFSDWEWWYRDVIGGVYLLKGRDGLPASTYKHDEELRVVPKGKHPILKGIGPMHLWDETYKNMWISPEVNVLLTTDNPTSDGPLAWVSPYPKARVAFIQLGHGSTAHQHPGYRQLVENAILWSAGKLN
jgi:type 1 glutamine amidotransferase